MLLFKCECGCHFTIKNETKRDNNFVLICNNCKKQFRFDDENRFGYNMRALKENGFEMYILPDDTKLELSSSL